MKTSGKDLESTVLVPPPCSVEVRPLLHQAHLPIAEHHLVPIWFWGCLSPWCDPSAPTLGKWVETSVHQVAWSSAEVKCPRQSEDTLCVWPQPYHYPLWALLPSSVQIVWLCLILVLLGLLSTVRTGCVGPQNGTGGGMFQSLPPLLAAGMGWWGSKPPSQNCFSRWNAVAQPGMLLKDCSPSPALALVLMVKCEVRKQLALEWSIKMNPSRQMGSWFFFCSVFAVSWVET